jgi:putative FmdB family regulatory protein
MPTYEFICRKCGKRFSEAMTIAEHGKKKPKCPKCSSHQVEQSIAVFYANTSKKS